MSRVTIRYCSYWVSGIHAVRVAARLRRELGIQVDLVHARYGEFKLLIDDRTVIDGGALAFLGVLPSTQEIVATVREALSL